METKNRKNEKRVGHLRAEARASYTIKRSLPLDIAAGVISVLLAAVVWFFAA